MSKSATAPTWENLFNESSYHEISKARSVLSPAAYFVDLVRVIQTYITGETFTTRRSDLQSLLLNEENTFTEVPKLQIVNTVLQNAIEQATGNSPLNFSSIQYPLNLPYNHQVDRIHTYLAQQGLTWEQLREELLPPGFSSQLLPEVLGIGEAPWQIITTDVSSDTSSLSGYLDLNPADDLVTQLQDSSAFTQKTGLKLKEVEGLANQDLSEAEISEGLQSDFFINGGEKGNEPFAIEYYPNISAHSQGYHDGSYLQWGLGYIKVNDDELLNVKFTGQDSTNVRGVHVVQIDPVTHQVLENTHFDTWLNAANATDLAEYVSKISKDVIVVMAVVDSAAKYINGVSGGSSCPQAVSAIEALGSQKISQIIAGSGWTFIGYQGNVLAEQLTTAGNTSKIDLGSRASLGNLDNVKLDRINRFIRMSKATGFSFTELDWIIRTISLGSKAAIDDNLIEPITWIKSTMASHGLTVNQCCGMIGLIKDTGAKSGKTFFDSLFNNALVSNPPAWQSDGKYDLVWTFNPTTDESSDKENTGGLTSTLAGILGISSKEVITAGQMIAVDKSSLTLTLQHLSILYRIAQLSKIMNLSVTQLNRLTQNILTPVDGNKVATLLVSTDPSEALQALQAIEKFTEWLSQSGLSFDKLEFIIHGSSENPQVQNQIVGQTALSNFAQAISNSLTSTLVNTEGLNQSIGSELRSVIADFNQAQTSETSVNDSALVKSPVSNILQELQANGVVDTNGVVNGGSIQGLTSAIFPSTKQPAAGEGTTTVATASAKASKTSTSSSTNQTVTSSPSDAQTLTAYIAANESSNSVIALLDKLTSYLQAAFEHQQRILASSLSDLLNLSVQNTGVIIQWGDKNNKQLITGQQPPSNSMLSFIWECISGMKSDTLLPLLRKMQQPAMLLTELKLSNSEASFFKTIEPSTSIYPITYEMVLKVFRFKELVAAYQDGQSNLLTLLQANVNNTVSVPKTATATTTNATNTSLRSTEANSKSNANSTVSSTTSVSVSDISGCSPGFIDELTTVFGSAIALGTVDGVYRLYVFQKYCEQLNIELSQLFSLLVPSTQIDWTKTAEALWSGLKKDTPKATCEALSLHLDEKLRDHLVPFAFSKLSLDTVDELYAHLLIDVEVSGVVKTSKVKEAVSAAQLYIYRCLNQLENGITYQSELTEIWNWMHAYSEWEANREVLLYPENYIQPGLRKNKTTLFTKLEHSLKQANLADTDSVEPIFREYLNGFALEANLLTDSFSSRDYTLGTSAYKDLCFIGKSKTQKGEYYFRVATFIKSGSGYQPQSWGEWKKINQKVHALGTVACVYAFSTWYIFWVVQKQTGANNSGDSSNPNWEKKHQQVIQYSKFDISGKWISAQTLGPFDPDPQSDKINSTFISSDSNNNANLVKKEVYPIYLTSAKSLFVPGGNTSVVNFTPTEASTKERGVFVLQLDAVTGEQLAVQQYDTWENPNNSVQLCDFLNGIPEGDYVVMGTIDDASRYITGPSDSAGEKNQDTINAIKAFGSTEIESLEFRSSWGFIGQKGHKALAEGLAPGGTPVALQANVADSKSVLVITEGNNTKGSFGTIYMQLSNLYTLSTSSLSKAVAGVHKYSAQSIPSQYPKELNATLSNGFIMNYFNVNGNIGSVKTITETITTYVSEFFVKFPETNTDYVVKVGKKAILGDVKSISLWINLPTSDEVLLMDTLKVQAGQGVFLNGATAVTSTNPVLKSNEWHLITISGGQLYIDGQEISGGSGITTSQLSGSFSGLAQEVIFFNAVLSATQISELYSNGKASITQDYSTSIDPGSVFSSSLLSCLSQPNWSIASDGYAEYLFIPKSTTSADVYRLNTNAVPELEQYLNQPKGIQSLLSISAQQTSEPALAEIEATGNATSIAISPSSAIDFSLNSAMSNYYWELFFHAPFLIANELSHHGQFQLARQWYQYIFDPSVSTANWQLGSDAFSFDTYWRFLGLREVDNTSLSSELSKTYINEIIADASSKQQIQISNTDPFDPQAIADVRPVAYQRTVFAHFVKNLIAWGDQLFRQNTRESIIESEMIYVAAQNLLGVKPDDQGRYMLGKDTAYRFINSNIITGSVITSGGIEIGVSEQITCLFDHGETLYIGSSKGLYSQLGSNTATKLEGMPDCWINCVYVNNDGIYVATQANGLWMQATGSSNFVNVACPINDIREVQVISGFFNIIGSKNQNYYTSIAASSNVQLSDWELGSDPQRQIFAIDGCIYCALAGSQGISYSINDAKTWQTLSGTADKSIMAMTPSKDQSTLFVSGIDGSGDGFVLSYVIKTGVKNPLQWDGEILDELFHDGFHLFGVTQSSTILKLELSANLDTFVLASSNVISAGSKVLKTSETLYVAADGNRLVPYSKSGFTPYFGVPRNAQMLSLWSILANRIYDIRNGLNIEGHVDQLPLFQPAANPNALVSAMGNGVGASSDLPRLYGSIPYYRFRVMIEKAKEAVQSVIQLGQSLLSALERKDATELANIHQSNEQHILHLSMLSKKDQVSAARSTVTMMEKSLQSAQNRQQHYQKLIDNGYLPSELAQVAMQALASDSQLVATEIRGVSVMEYLMPDIFGFSDGGMKWGDAVNQGAAVADGTAGILQTGSQLAGTVASYQRRAQDWKLQESIAKDDVEQIGYQILAAKARESIADQEITLLNTQIEQEQKIASFYKTKFTNEQLYQWYVGKVSALYYQAYELAHELAIQAENAWNFEQMGLTQQIGTFIKGGYWNDLYQGLLAGNALELDLHRMEKAYFDSNVRKLEIEKTISLALLDAAALKNLKETGTCQFDITQKNFDADYPGHYCRQIKTLSVSIPMILGPYQNLHATLRQVSNRIVVSEEEGQDPVVDIRPNEQIAISRGLNESGLFVLHFDDERYLPFEGTGAVSSWQLDLPKANNALNYDSISDVIIKLNYTALPGNPTKSN